MELVVDTADVAISNGTETHVAMARLGLPACSSTGCECCDNYA